MVEVKTEVLFPPSLIPELRDLRGERWQNLVDSVSDLAPENPERLAFILLMVRLGGCATCHADAYWAMQGCQRCSSNTISRFKGSDDELLARYQTALLDVQEYLQKQAAHYSSASV
jgi:hypothetical protein